MSTTKPRIIALCALLALATAAQATLQDYESFDYSATTLANQGNNTGWAAPCGLVGLWFITGTSQDNVLSNDGISLSYPVPFEAPLTTPPSSGSRVNTGGLSANASNSRLLAKTIDLSVDGTVRYASALFRKNRPNGEATTDNVLIEFVDTPGNRRWGFGIEGTGDKPWLNANGSLSAGTPVTVGQTYLIVTKIVSSATGLDTAYLKVYGPGYDTQFPATEPTTWDVTLTETTAAVLDRLRVRVDSGNQAGTPGEVDDIRVGDSWQDVANVLVAPPPDTTAPIVLSVDSLVTNVINVIFSEPVSQATAENPSNYTITNGSITAIALRGCTNVQITLDAAVTASYTVGVSNIQDVVGNTLVGTNVAGITHGWQRTESISLALNQGMVYAMHTQVVMFADGADVTGTADHFQYLFNTVSGDFDLAVKVSSLFRANNNSRAGLMARLKDDSAPQLTYFDSPNVLIEAVPDRFIFQYRTNSAEATLAVGTNGDPATRPSTAFPNCWIRLVRSGSVFTGYSGTNYGVWQQIGSFDTSVAITPYPSDILVGLVASSGNASVVTRAQFSGFGPSVVYVPPTLSVALGNANVEVSWGLPSVGFTLQTNASIVSPVAWTDVPNSDATNRVFVPISSGPLYFRAIHY